LEEASPPASKENAPHEAGHYLNLGGPGRNRTTDTRIFNTKNHCFWQ